MPLSCGTRAFIQGRRLVMTDETSVDDAQLSGRWISSADTVEVRQ